MSRYQWLPLRSQVAAKVLPSSEDTSVSLIRDGNRRYYEGRPWWRHQMETFSALLALCAGNSPVSGEFPAQRPVTRSFGVFFDLHLIKRLSKHPRCWWFETIAHPVWRHCNAVDVSWTITIVSFATPTNDHWRKYPSPDPNNELKPIYWG